VSMLFTPGKIGTLGLPNRLVRSATAERMADADGRPRPQLRALYEELVRGGVGLIVTGHMVVHPSGKAHAEMTGIHSDEMVPGLAELAEAVHRQGGRVVAQINHGGMQCSRETVPQTIAPSKMEVPFLSRPAREMTRDEIALLIQAYGQAARRAREAGFDGVQLHGAHGYLIGQFLSPFVNRRTDEWGGDLEGRMRFLRAVSGAVREQVGPDYPVLIKLGMVDGVIVHWGIVHCSLRHFIHLAHANGFPPGTYRPLAETLTDRYHVVGLPSRPLWPGSRPASAPDWHPLADDLIEGLDSLRLKGIVGVGHSLGGVLTMWAAVCRPDLLRAVVLIDPVILPPGRLWVLRLLRALRLERRLPLVQATLRRRRAWPSRRACYEHYRHKPLFAVWPEASLWAYVEAATRERANGQVELVYPPEWEAHIFATAPTDAWQAVPHLHTPALVVRGEHSATFRPECLARMARLLPHARFAVISGAGHLAPMERPAETGMVIQTFLDAEGAPSRADGR